MKIKDFKEDEDNYFKKDVFTFNKYKTARFKQFGEQTVKLPKELLKIIKKWNKLNPTEYLLFDSQKNKLSPTKLTQRLNKILGKKASINILRHSFLSDKYKNLPSLLELEDEAKEMGHSLKEHLEYIKK
jgi:integrase